MNTRRLSMIQWYARRPRMWKQLFRVVREKRTTPAGVRSDPTLPAASRRWCESVAVSVEVAVTRVTSGAGLASLEAECGEEVGAGRAAEKACPVKMGSGASVDLVYSVAEGIACRKAIETGVAFGWSSFALLHSVAKRHGRLFSTDMPYPLRDNDRYVGCVVPPRLRRHWRLLRYPDRDGLPIALRELGTIDLCHYDSDKSEAGRRWAYPLLWNALRPGGVFITDDVQDNFGYRDFCAELNLPPLVARVPERSGFKYSGLIVHP